MSLYEQLGGDDAIAIALDRFYDKVLADPEVSRYFEHVNVDRVKTKQRSFPAIAGTDKDDVLGR